MQNSAKSRTDTSGEAVSPALKLPMPHPECLIPVPVQLQLTAPAPRQHTPVQGAVLAQGAIPTDLT